ncbi:Endonuclease-reverse transcriptase [Operophtera brumata]|uniref:Endonuclease-reverse transcriptase n=1 Tax=Operophtera brumata TaxID=104452 RepID=A0A0L7L7G4_OPEBR|nr:Endonuclease-reverse transcriptase [Operophtera brumata]
MEEQFQLLFDSMKIEMQKQTAELTESLPKKLMDTMDEKLTPIIEENEQLKQKVSELETEMEYLKRDKKNNNVIFFGLEEGENSTSELFKNVKVTLKEDLNIIIEQFEINKLYRLGKNKVQNKSRPVLCSFVNAWRKDEIMENKKSFICFNCMLCMCDYSKEVLERRKALLPKLKEEREKGNTAFLKYDKLVVKESNTEKRKREPTTSPSPSKTQPRKQQIISSVKANRINAFDAMRHRSNSLTNRQTPNKQ